MRVLLSNVKESGTRRCLAGRHGEFQELQTAHCSLPTANCPLPTAHCYPDDRRAPDAQDALLFCMTILKHRGGKGYLRAALRARFAGLFADFLARFAPARFAVRFLAERFAPARFAVRFFAARFAGARRVLRAPAFLAPVLRALDFVVLAILHTLRRVCDRTG
jgi:hypothetical protein